MKSVLRSVFPGGTSRFQLQIVGSSKLRASSAAVSPDELRSANTRDLIASMFKTMKSSGGCGLAAPQLGVHKRIVAIQLPWQPELPHVDAFDRTVLVNPRLVATLPRLQLPLLDPAGASVQSPYHAVTNKYEMYESCLSVPQRWGRVIRDAHVRVAYTDEGGRPQQIRAWGYHAAILQHELDHLDGVLYIDRIANPQKDLVSTDVFYRLYPVAAWAREFGGHVKEPAT